MGSCIFCGCVAKSMAGGPTTEQASWRCPEHVFLPYPFKDSFQTEVKTSKDHLRAMILATRKDIGVIENIMEAFKVRLDKIENQ